MDKGVVIAEGDKGIRGINGNGKNTIKTSLKRESQTQINCLNSPFRYIFFASVLIRFSFKYQHVMHAVITSGYPERNVHKRF